MPQATFSRRATVSESELGEMVLTVACTIGGSVSNPTYKPRDGDSAFLAAGTELREINGYRSDLGWPRGRTVSGMSTRSTTCRVGHG